MKTINKKQKKQSVKTTDSFLFESYKLNLQPNIKKIQEENKISVENNKETILEMLKKETGSSESNYLIYTAMAKCRIEIPGLYYEKLRELKLKSSSENKNNLSILIDEKKINHLSEQIRKFEEEILPPSERKLINLIENHIIPSRLWSLLKNFIIYGDFGDKFNISNCTSFKYQNLSTGQDEENKQWYVEIKLFGDTAKKEILDNWPLINSLQKRLLDYRSSKSKLRSPIYDKIAEKISKDDSPEDIIDDLDDLGSKDMSKVKNYSKKLKKLKIQKYRRNKFYNLKEEHKI